MIKALTGRSTQRKNRMVFRYMKRINRAALVMLLSVVLVFILFACSPSRPGQGPLLSLEGVHELGTTCLAFDSSGERLVSGGFLGEIRVWSVPRGTQLTKLEGHRAGSVNVLSNRAVRGLAWVDDTLVVSGASDGRIMIWDVCHGRELNATQTPSPISSLVRLEGEDLIATGHKDGWARVYTLPVLDLSAKFDMGAPVLSVAFDKEQGRLAAIAKGGRVAILSPGMRLIRDLDRAPRNALEIRFSPDGEELAGGAWFRLLFWDVRTGRVRTEDTEHLGAVISIDYSPDGKRLVSLGRITDSKIYLLNVEAGSIERRLTAHRLCGAMVRFSPDGRFVASASDDESIRLYDLSQPYSQ